MDIKYSVIPKLSAILFGLLLSFGAVLFFPHNTFSASWTIEIVDAEDAGDKELTDFYQRFIAVDKFNLPHIVYGEGHLFYAYYDGMVWRYETVDSSQGVGRYASIGIDSNNKMHISYHDNTNSDLKYATNSRSAEDGDNNSDGGSGGGCFFNALVELLWSPLKMVKESQ